MTDDAERVGVGVTDSVAKRLGVFRAGACATGVGGDGGCCWGIGEAVAREGTAAESSGVG